MNWVKGNWTKIFLLICGLIITYSFYNYLVIVPKQKQLKLVKDELLENEDACRKIGNEFFEKYERDEKSSLLNKTIIPARFHYNEKESTCFVETGTITFFSGNGSQEYRFIKNLKTNVFEASYTSNITNEMDMELVNYNLQQQKDYLARKHELFEISNPE